MSETTSSTVQHSTNVFLGTPFFGSFRRPVDEYSLTPESGCRVLLNLGRLSVFSLDPSPRKGQFGSPLMSGAVWDFVSWTDSV